MNLHKETFTDYYSHANSQWLKNFNLPDEYSRYSTFQIISTKINEQINTILQTLESRPLKDLNDEQKLIVVLYNKIRDYKLRDQLGIQPLEPLYKLVDSIGCVEKLGKILGLLATLDFSPLISIQVCQDLKFPNYYILNITEPDCILPSQDYYVKPEYKSIQLKYIEFIESYLTLTQPKLTKSIKSTIAKKIFEFEKIVSSYLLPNVKRRNVDNVHNLVDFKYIESLVPNLNFSQIIKQLGDLNPHINSHLKKINSFNFDYFIQLNQLITESNFDIIIQYIKLYIFVKMGRYLSTECETLCFNFFSKVINGTEKQKPLDTKTIEIMSGLVGELIGKEYISMYYNPIITTHIEQMITKIKNASCDIITRCKWMCDKTKQLAIQKINLMQVLIGHPNVFKDWKPLIDSQLDKKNLIEILFAYNLFYSHTQLGKLGSKPNINEWHMNAYDVNAYYNPQLNQIVFPAGILQEPFFSLNASFEENLGGIGTVIAHEISHGFDDQGRKFDSKGQLSQWWTSQDIKAFEQKVKPLVDQFNSIKILGYNVSGKLTLGENIADYTAVTICTRVLELESSKSHQYKLLYKSYANIWKQKIRQGELIKRLQTDPHAPARYRTNQILSNIPKFIQVYSLDPSHPMFIQESERVKLWH